SKATGRAYSGGIDDLRLYDSALTAEQAEQLGVRHPIQTTLSGISGKRSKEESERLREYFLTEVGPDQIKRQYSELKDLKKQKADVDKSILNVMVMMELGKPRDTFILARGDYRNKGEKVTAGVPAVLPPLPMQAPDREGADSAKAPNRLALAKWLMDANHPLTARVAVNRYWQMLFGFGIVKTVEDFGVQGERPVHPELLDWLAVTFRDGGTEGRRDGEIDSKTNPQSAIRNPQSKAWDVKALLKLMVMSATYRQSSKMTVQVAKENPQSAIRNPQSDDPENRLLSRGPRHRLQAELVRDNALAISRLLDDRIGGKSVKPYHPAGLWEEMAFGDGFSEQEYVLSKGRDLYRRSMYTFWKRTVPPAQMSAFDAPDREKCVARRATTNTPLQALVLMNDPTY
ncbi:MAG: DUF1553 domain-containing protein, partial [Blastocatellia bacterium]